jgi:hypothetical protein
MSISSSPTDLATLRVFVSSAPADQPHARHLKSLLSRRGNLRVFSAQLLSAGEDWSSRARQELLQCDLFIVLLTPAAAQSGWVLQELGAAWGLNKPIAVVVTHPELPVSVPIPLDAYPVVELGSLEDPEAVERLLEAGLGEAPAAT